MLLNVNPDSGKGRADYVLFQDELVLQYIETAEGRRREGLASALLARIEDINDMGAPSRVMSRK